MANDKSMFFDVVNSLVRSTIIPGQLNLDPEDVADLLDNSNQLFYCSMPYTCTDDVKEALINTGFDFDIDIPQECWIGIEADNLSLEDLMLALESARQLTDYDGFRLSGIEKPENEDSRINVLIVGY